jgi:hypothetical protein
VAASSMLSISRQHVVPVMREKPKLSIKFDKTQQDLGNVRVDTTYDVIFTFRNQGQSPARVRRIFQGRSCVRTEEQDFGSDVLPGERGQLKLTFSTFGFRPPRNLSERVVVEFAGEPGNFQVLTFSARLEEDVRLSPSIVEVPMPIPVGGYECELTIDRLMLPSELFAQIVVTPPMGVDCSLRAKDPEAVRYGILVRPGSARRRFVQPIVVSYPSRSDKSDPERMMTIDVPFKAVWQVNSR